MGGDGNDVLIGSRFGRNVLVGGTGKDRLVGGRENDNLLIGGTTAYDNQDDALLAILSEWASSNPVSGRIDHLMHGVGDNARVKLTLGDTVLDDGAVDDFFGGRASDWILSFASDRRRVKRK